jgi:hypothetical protein
VNDSLSADPFPIWHYADKRPEVRSLYELAKRKTWNVSQDISWETSARPAPYPSLKTSNPLNGFDSYEILSAETKRHIAWLQHGLEISEILHGEQAALILSSQLVSCLPTMDSRLFASAQVFDEARHVEFFARYLREIAGEFHAPSAELKTLVKTSIGDSRWDMKFLTCQILIESLALARFQELRQVTQIPLLRAAIDYIAKDEARHVRFGTAILKEYVNELSSEGREQRAEFVLESMLNLGNAMNVETRIADRMGWDKFRLRQHLRIHRLKTPDIARGRFRILARGLKEIGLLTNRMQERLTRL